MYIRTDIPFEVTSIFLKWIQSLPSRARAAVLNLETASHKACSRLNRTMAPATGGLQPVICGVFRKHAQQRNLGIFSYKMAGEDSSIWQSNTGFTLKGGFVCLLLVPVGPNQSTAIQTSQAAFQDNTVQCSLSVYLSSSESLLCSCFRCFSLLLACLQ